VPYTSWLLSFYTSITVGRLRDYNFGIENMDNKQSTPWVFLYHQGWIKATNKIYHFVSYLLPIDQIKVELGLF